MVEKSVIIIGAGIAGLSTGCYAQMNGYHTRIFEMHDNPGGLCTAWQRKGYTVDGCLHWLMNSSPGSEMYRLWEELGVVQGQQIINMEQFYRVEGADGKVLTLYCDIDRLEQHMKKVAPEDTRLISDCARAIRRFTRMNLPVLKAQELYSPLDGLKLMFKMLPFMGDLRRWGRISMKELALRFRNPLLRDAWLNMWPPEFTALFMLITLATFHQKASGYPIGGSMQVSRAIEKRYLGLGGEIKYKSKVDKIIVENDRAVGVRLADGGEHRADYVISAADGHATIFDMLDGKYINDKIRGYYESLPIFPPLVFVSLGVNRSFEELPKMISGLVLTLEKPVTIGGGERKWLYVRIHNFDPTLAPPGKTLLTIMMESNYPYWEALHKDLARYKAEKEQIADTVVSLLDKRFPGLAAQVEMRDVATPVTFHRYTGNWQGSFEGWLVTPKTLMLNMSKTLPGLDCFYMAGQWVAPGGGLPSGAMTGRYVTQMLCKRDKKRFAATTP
ncbi:MAG: NAD(P)/FAD-dependent oxidoreductase [Dehalococcoidia bacterium]|nr:NAD(P)/FAD-dependent oxidoreductase [Dehalococcoidia bacterium]